MSSSAHPAPDASPVRPVAVDVPVAVLLDARLSHPASRLYAVLASYPPDDPPSVRQLRADLDVGERSIQRWFMELERAGWVEREPRWAQVWGLTVHREPVTR
jgi:hypothetical protein